MKPKPRLVPSPTDAERETFGQEFWRNALRAEWSPGKALLLAIAAARATIDEPSPTSYRMPGNETIH